MSFKLVTGPMKAGKSSEIIKETTRTQIYASVIVINHAIDPRKQGKIKTHSGYELEAQKVTELNENIPGYADARLVIIDEGQFFNQDELYQFVRETMRRGKRVMVCGLDGDSDQKNFINFNLLLPLATEVIKLSGFCEFCKDGTLSHYSICKKKRRAPIDVDAEYFTVCFKHMEEHLRKKLTEGSDDDEASNGNHH